MTNKQEPTEPLPAPAGSAVLANETKIKVGNAFYAMEAHLRHCQHCCEYMHFGDGDLCDYGKNIIAREFAYADTRLHQTSGCDPETE